MPKQRTTAEKYYTPAPPPTATPPPDPNRLVRLPEILTILPIKKSTWWKWCQEGKAPAAVRLGRVTAWKYVDVVKLAQEGITHG